MLIRSQDKMNLFDMIGCNVMIRNDHAIIGVWNNQPSDDVTYLGAYHSEQRAIAVLDEICEKYDAIKRSEFLGMEESGFVGNIFEMPEE